MKTLRLLIGITLSFLICYADQLTDPLYSYAAGDHFRRVGILRDFSLDCSALPEKYRDGCGALYRVPMDELLLEQSVRPEIIEVGVGVISGNTEWFCTTGDQLTKIFENNPYGSTVFRDGLMLYSTATLPTAFCGDALYVKAAADPRNFVSNVGWKSGSLVAGRTSVIRSYKNVVDFFSSYLRILIALLCLLLMFVSKSFSSSVIRGYAEYRAGILFLSLHFLASSSIVDVIFPNAYGLGFVILMAGGTTGCFYLTLSAFRSSNRIPISKTLDRALKTIRGPAIFTCLAAYYLLATGQNYLTIQALLSAASLAISIISGAPSFIIFSALFISNVLAAAGIFPGHPSNTATHFILILFIIDSFEGIHLGNALTNLTSHAREKLTAAKLTELTARRFSLDRLSTSMFTREFEFVTKRLFFDREELLATERKISRLAAHVMTARRPLLRIRVGSEESRILKGPNAIDNKQRGKEFCIYPLVHSERILGTLNISGYPSWTLSDPSQMFLFDSMMKTVLPLLASTRYREDLSPNIDDLHSIREIENKFLSAPNKGKITLLDSFSAISKRIDAKAIVSRAVLSKDQFETFSNHHYGENEARFLETHTPNLSGSLLASPANVAYFHQSTVFLSDLENMFSIYPEFLVKLLRANGTKTLFVKPIYLVSDKSSPWGVVWIEFGNRTLRPEADLRDLAEFATASMERMLAASFEFTSQQSIVNEISATVPKHVLDKIKDGINPREEEEGYILNIDLAGSTPLSKKLGTKQFAQFIRRMNEELSVALSRYGFTSQIIVWDCCAFTRAKDCGPLIDDIAAKNILSVIDQVIGTLNLELDRDCHVSFRAVINFGDITRDWSEGNSRHWTITGSAFAESCKLESDLKPGKRILLLASSCPGQGNKHQILAIESSKAAA